MRATSLRKPRILVRLSVCPIFSWNLRRKSWSLSSCCWCSSSASVRFLSFSTSIVFLFCALAISFWLLAFSRSCLIQNTRANYQLLIASSLVRIRAGHKLCPKAQFVRRQPHCFLRIGAVHAFHLKQDLARTYHGNPVIRRAFAFTHTGFGRLLGHGLVRKQADPYLAAALHKTRHGNAACLDLAVGDPARFHHLQPEIAEGEFSSAPGLTAHATALLLAVLNFFRH